MENFLKVRIELEALLTEREAMLAANAERRDLGEALMYDYNHFMELATRIRELSNIIKRGN